MSCSTCKHWNISSNLRDYRDIADCQYVVGAIQPNILSCLSLNSNPLTLPFDPHDAVQFKFNPVFRQEMRQAIERASKSGLVYVEKERGKVFFRTNQNFLCQYYERCYEPK